MAPEAPLWGHAYHRGDANGGQSKLVLWNRPGDDVLSELLILLSLSDRYYYNRSREQIASRHGRLRLPL